jgi:hypothetical protein
MPRGFEEGIDKYKAHRLKKKKKSFMALNNLL